MNILFWIVIFLMTLFAVGILVFPIRKQKKYFLILCVFIFPIFSFSLYGHWGGFQQLRNHWLLKEKISQAALAMSKIKGPDELISRLRAHLGKHPADSKAWYLLGKLYFGQRQYVQSALALKEAYHRKPGDMKFALAYVQASFFRNGQRLPQDDLKILKHVVINQPNNVSAINLLAVHFYLRKQYQLAMNYWEKLLPFFKAGSRDQEKLLSMIASARQKKTIQKRQ